MSHHRHGIVEQQQSASSGGSPYYVGDVYREGSPQKQWIDSLRGKSEREPEAMMTAAAAPQQQPPALPLKPQQQHQLRSAKHYQPMPPQQPPLRFAFDMDLSEYSELSEATSHSTGIPASPKALLDPSGDPDPHSVPPLFTPSSYTFQDLSKRKQQQQQQSPPK